MNLICLLMIGLLPQPELFESVDAIEINIVLSERTLEPTYRQIIFWSRHPSGLRIRDYRWMYDAEQYTYHQRGSASYLFWVENSKICQVFTKTIYESHSMYDREFADREFVAFDRRRKLWQVIDRKPRPVEPTEITH